MMARDVEVINIGPALEGIKAAMNDKEVQEFLKKFKPGTQVPRRMAAAFGAILFLAEKVGRGFGEKVSIIRFADEAQVLTLPDGKLWMDSSSGQKGVLESTARKIVSDIGNAFGQSTNMGQAMLKAQEILMQFQIEKPDQPTMIVLLTDGEPTDGDAFFQAVQMIAKNPNVVLYIIGLGNPDDNKMKRAAAMCGGEYFKPKDSGELLVWYSKRARDLQVKLKKTS
jgi:Mg-chelatase subunit ChlD